MASPHLLSPPLHPTSHHPSYDSDSDDVDTFEMRTTTYHDAWGAASAAGGVIGWQSIQDLHTHLGVPGEKKDVNSMKGIREENEEEERRRRGWHPSAQASSIRFGLMSDVYQDPTPVKSAKANTGYQTSDPLFFHLNEDEEASDEDVSRQPRQEHRMDASLMTSSTQPTLFRDAWRPLVQARTFDDTPSGIGPESDDADQYKDWPVAMAYLACMGTFALLGFYLFFNTSSGSLGAFLPKSFYALFTDNLVLLAFAMTAAFILGAVWLSVLQQHLRALVKFQMIVVPVAAGACATWMLAEAFAAPIAIPGETVDTSPNVILLVGAIMTVILTTGFAGYARWKWTRLDASLSVIELSLTVLKDNPDLIAVAIALNALWIAFLAFWLLVATRLTLLIHPLGNIWEPDASTGYLSIFCTIVFVWTAHILDDIQRLTTAAVVAEWYFHRSKRTPPACGLAAIALLRASTYQLGTCALAAIYDSVAGVAKTVLKAAVRILRHVPAFGVFSDIVGRVIAGTPIKSWVMAGFGVRADAQKLAPAYAGMANMAYKPSVDAVMRVLRRNLILRFDLDYVVRLVFWLSSLLVSVAVALVVYTSSIHAETASKWDSTLLAAVAGAAQFHVVRFYARVVSSTTDAAFLCWCADVDQGMNRCDAAHRAFGSATQVPSDQV